MSKTLGLAVLAPLALSGGVRPELDWKAPSAGGSRSGDLVTVSLTAKGTATFGAKVDLSRWAGKILKASIRSRGDAVVAAKHDWLGYKFMFHFRDVASGIECWPGAPARVGTWDWTTTSFRVDLRGRSPEDATLSLGLQDTCGTVCFDLRTLCFEEVEPLFPVDDDDTKCVYSPRVRNMARMRGCMSPSRPCVEDDLKTLGEWGANLMRYQIVRDWHGRNNNRDVGEYLHWVDSKVTHLLEDVLPWANAAGIQVVVDLHVPPGGRAENGDMNMFYDARFADAFLSAWTNIAACCCNRSGIWGYDLINEPSQRAEALSGCDYLTLQERAAKLVRRIDPVTPIIIESNGWDSPSEFQFLRALKLKDVIYQVHMYEPSTFTHQGVNAKNDQWKRLVYPSSGLDKSTLRRFLRQVRDFQGRHDAIIYVGEFSAVAWAAGADRYIGDCISIFEEYGWHWSYHAFREWDGWSVEHEAAEQRQLRPSRDNPRRRALLEGLGLNSGKLKSDAERHCSTEMNQTEVSDEGVGRGDVRLLVLGNSIALHGAAPQLGWTNAWGMAASSADRDFAHLVARDLERMLGKAVDLRIRNLSRFELNVSSYDLKSHDETDWKPDVVIIALGENVQEKDISPWGNRLVELGSLYRKANPSAQIVYRTVFWPNAAKDAKICEAASRVPGAILADLKGCGACASNTARGRFSHPGVAAHPGDAGMRRIADAILVALSKNGGVRLKATSQNAR